MVGGRTKIGLAMHWELLTGVCVHPLILIHALILLLH